MENNNKSLISTLMAALQAAELGRAGTAGGVAGTMGSPKSTKSLVDFLINQGYEHPIARPGQPAPMVPMPQTDGTAHDAINKELEINPYKELETPGGFYRELEPENLQIGRPVSPMDIEKVAPKSIYGPEKLDIIRLLELMPKDIVSALMG